jgi:Fe-S-cluster-containing hydrogenase component 2
MATIAIISDVHANIEALETVLADIEENTMAAQVDSEKCTGCGLCVDACPVEAIALENDKAKVDADKCVDCGRCVEECSNEAIRIP